MNKGDFVRALLNFDRDGAGVHIGDLGVVVEERNAHNDGGGPIVKWLTGNKGYCNVYPEDGWVEQVHYLDVRLP